MESRNGGASSEGFLIPVSESSDVFQSNILAPLQSAYLYDESKQFFRYNSAVLIKNPDLEDKYKAFRAEKINAGYSQDDLKETCGFLLFEDDSKANALAGAGVISGNSTCTTLGDPTKGVYISMYSDCLDLNRWYHGKSGYIAIIRLTKGKVKKVAENYTQNFTEPTVGFDCHVSEQLPSVSAKTSSFLAFERTQFYIYELLHDGSGGTSQSPSAACPFAIVSFSYMDTKASPVPQQRSEVKKQVRHYLPWRGKLQIEGQFYHIDLRSTAVAFIPAQLPSVITVNRAICMSVLRHLLPRAVFETSYNEEVFLEGFYCDLCEFGPSDANKASSFALLLSEIKEKDLAFCIPLNDGGFLILMHSSHFLRYDDAESASAEVMQGLFVFPDSRVVRRDIKFGEKNSALSSQIQLVLPVLSYAEGEAEKTSMDPKDDLCEVLAHHMQSYATLINPGFSSSPFRSSRELSIFPDQYDVAEAHKHLYSSPEWNNGTWQTFKSYISKPDSFQIPIAKVSEILASGQDERREDLDDDVYICVSSPEEAPTSPVCMEAEDPLSDEQSLGNIETSMDIGLPSVELQIAPTPVSRSVVADDLQSENVTKDNLKCTLLTEQPNKPDDPRAQGPLTPPTSEDLPAELIVSITSAEQSVPDDVSAAKHTDFHFSGLSTMAKLQTAEVNSVIESDKAKKCLDFSVVTKHQTTTKRRKRRRRCYLARKKISKTSVKTPSLKTAISSVEVEHLSLKTEEHNEELSLPQLRNSLKPKWKKLHRRKRRFGKLSSKRKLRPAVDSTKAGKKKSNTGLESLESTIILGFEALPLRKKTERWDLKPVISECGRILLPFGSGDQVKSMPCTKKDECLERLSHEVPVTLPDPVITDKQLGPALETAIAETTATNTIDVEGHHLDPGDNILTLPEDDSGGVPLIPNFCTSSPGNDDTNSFSPKAVETEHLESSSPVNLSAKGELLLSKLKSVLSRRKRKLDLTIKQQLRENADEESEPCFKKTKVDSDTDTPKDSNSTPQSVSVSKIPSVDPHFAYCLGLTPKENLTNVQNTKELDTLKRKGSTEKDEHTSLDKQRQIVQRPLSIFPRRSRIKTLKRHQGISAENVKRKWWLHFQTPACFTSEKKYNDCTNDNTVRKTVKEQITCTSTDALNLLADLALSNDKAQPQPNQALERTPKESMKKCDLSKGLSSSDQESVLHALLRNPAARALQSPESPSTCSFVADNELVALISKDHAYSLPPSSSLLLDLPGTTFLVPPLSGSTRLLNHRHTMYDNGAKILHASVNMEDIGEHNKTSEYVKKQKFKCFRTFIIKEKSIQVTRKWEENYNFNLDSRFTSDPKDKVIIRALHGPWNSSLQDTVEEVRLIFHMWIGLFYSRSTARFFQVDPTFMPPCLEESGSLEIASAILPGQTRPDPEINSAVALSSRTETPDPVVSKMLDLSKKVDTVSVPESVILDLSVKSFGAKPVPSEQQLNKVTSMSSEPLKTWSDLKPAADQQEKETFQLHKDIEHFRDISSEVKDEKDIKSKPTKREHKALCFHHYETPSSKSDRTFCQPEEMKNEHVEPENDGATFGTEPVLHGCSKEISIKKVGIERGTATGKSLPQEDALCSPTSVTDKEVNSNIDESNMLRTGVLDDLELKAKESCQMGNNPCQEGSRDPSLDTMKTNDESVNKEYNIVCNGNVVNEKLLSEESRASHDETDNLEGNMDCCAGLTSKEVKNVDDFSKKDEVDEKSCVSAADFDRDLRNQPLPKPCDSLVQQDYISDSSLIQMDEQLPLSDSTEDACLSVNPAVWKDESSTFDTSCTLSEIAHKSKDTVAQKNLDMNKTDCHKVVLPISDEGSCSFDDSRTDPCFPQEKDRVESLNENKASDLIFYTCSNDYKSQESNSACKEENVDKALLEPQESPSKVKCVCEVDEQFTEKSDPKTDETSCCMSRNLNLVPYPCIAKDMAGVNVVPPQDKVEEAVQGQEPIPFMNEVTEPGAALPDKTCGTSKISTKTEELSPCKISFIDEAKTPEALEKESDSRSPTLFIDEKPHDFNLCSSPISSIDVLSDTEDCQNVTGNSTPSTNELPFKPKLQTSTGNADPNPPCGLASDVKIRTLQVLQSINKFLSATNHVDICSQTETLDQKMSFDTSVFSSKKSVAPCLGSSHMSGGSRNKQTNNKKMKSCSTCTLRNLNRKASDVPTSFVKSKFEDLPGVDRETPVDPDFQPYKTFVSEGLREEQKTSQSNLSNESRPCSQRPVMAVKPSKTEESQTHWLSKDMDLKTTPQSKQGSGPVAKYSSPTSMFVRETKQFFIENSDALDSNHSICGPSKTTLLANPTYCKSDTEDKFALLNPHHKKKRNMPKLNQFPSSRLSSVQCSKSEESCPELGDGHPRFMEYTVNGTVEDITEHVTQRDGSDKSLTCDKGDALSEDGHVAGPQTSLQCTVFNSGQKRSYSFLEQFSQRCLQNDLTRASMEQECLIFLEKMKNLMKKSKREPPYQQDTYDSSMSCTSPLTVSFSSIEEQDDSMEILDTHLLRHKIKVDMSNSKDQAPSKEEGKVLHSVSHERNNPMAHAAISTMTAECARLYNAKMQDVCSAKKVPPRPKTKKGHRGDLRTDTSNHFDFCDQMKKELDETFRSNLNAVVKKSCKTKYRFYILVTSDEVFFEETKAQLEAEGHTAVRPSEFFLGEDSSSSLLIILRNEDIAEHICKIPHLLKLKMTPGVLFAGIDEPDDVINLTHQELFTRAGFVMFDRAVLEPLSICNMKKISKILQDLSRMGKWKWMLHYRDSRRLKENARLSEEANKKKLFMYWCQDAGILEVLPYHECDQMTRDQPDYLACLLRLHVQHISSRFPVFISDTTTEGAFEKNGILTMTLNTFLTKSPTEISSLNEKARLMSTL